MLFLASEARAGLPALGSTGPSGLLGTDVQKREVQSRVSGSESRVGEATWGNETLFAAYRQSTL